MAKKTRKRFDTGGYMAHGGKVELIFHGSSREIPMGEFDSTADAKRYVESSDWQRPYSIKKINKTPKVVRTQFEEEVFEYADGGEIRKFDPSYKFTYYEDNDLEKLKSDIIEDAKKHIKYVSNYYGTIKADELNSLLTRIKNANNSEELAILLDKLSHWFYDNTDIQTEMGMSKMAKGGETKPSLIPDYKKISNVEVEDIDRDDYPDFSDAYISYAEYDGEPMTDEQLEELNQDGLFVYDAIHMRLFENGGKVRQNKKDKLWESIKNKFSEIFYLKETDSNEIFSNDVTAEKKEYLYFASTWVTTTLSFEEAENKFKRMLTEDEKKIIKIERNVKDINEAFGLMSEKKILVKRIDKMADGGMMADGEVGEGFSIRDMREKLNRMFPDTFGFTVGNVSKEGNKTLNSAALIVDLNDPYRGLEDKDIQSKLFFPQYKRDHNINFRVMQGGENTYFYFALESEKGDEYIGQFGFKDSGDVPSSYITRFIAFLMEQYGLPFDVKHSIMADGGMMARGGKVNKRWIQDALTGNKGALRKTAKRKGLIRGDEKLSKSDLRKLEKMGGKTARRARLAETLIDFKK